MNLFVFVVQQSCQPEHGWVSVRYLGHRHGWLVFWGIIFADASKASLAQSQEDEKGCGGSTERNEAVIVVLFFFKFLKQYLLLYLLSCNVARKMWVQVHNINNDQCCMWQTSQHWDFVFWHCLHSIVQHLCTVLSFDEFIHVGFCDLDLISNYANTVTVRLKCKVI